MAYDAFLKVDGLSTDGGSVTFEVMSFTFGEATPTGGTGVGGGGVGKVRLEPLVVTKHTDQASAKLFQACATGEHIKTATLSLLPAVQNPDQQPEPFAKFRFSDVLVSSMQFDGSENGDILPLEQVRFEYQKVSVAIAEKGIGGPGSIVGPGSLK